MEFVKTHKLDRGTVHVFGNISQEMVGWYAVLYFVIWWFDRAFLGNQMMQIVFPVLLLVPLHFVVVATLELPVVKVISAMFRFGAFTADSYRVSHDPNPLPHVIPASHRLVIAKSPMVSGRAGLSGNRARPEVSSEVVS